MNERIERVNALVSGLRLTSVDLDQLYAKKNQLTPLESLEIFLSEQQRLRTEKQNLIRRKRANLPAEKTLETFDFGFQRSVSKEQMIKVFHNVKNGDWSFMIAAAQAAITNKGQSK